MAIATPISARASDRFGRRPVLIVGCIAAILSGFTMAPLLGSGNTYAVALFLTLELFLMGVTFAPMGALLPELFPTSVRYTGAGVAYNLGRDSGGVGGAVHRATARESRRAGVGGRLCVGGGGGESRRRAVHARDARYQVELSAFYRARTVRCVRGHRLALDGRHAPHILPVAPDAREQQQAADGERIGGESREPREVARRKHAQRGIEHDRHRRPRDETHEPLRADRHDTRQAARERADPSGMHGPREHPGHGAETHDAQRREVLLHVTGRRRDFDEELREREPQHDADRERVSQRAVALA